MTNSASTAQLHSVDASIMQAPNPNARRPYKKQCPFCQRAFVKTDHLERHLRSHTKEKPYICELCGKKYGRSDSLLRHQAAHGRPGRKKAHTGPNEQSFTSAPDVPLTESEQSSTSDDGAKNPYTNTSITIPSTDFFQQPSCQPTSALAFDLPQSTRLMTQTSTSDTLGNFDSNFSQPISSVTGDDSTILFDQSDCFIYDEHPVSWDAVDFNDLNLHLLGTVHSGNFETTAQLPQSLDSGHDQSAEPIGLGQNSDTIMLTTVERRWITRLESDNYVVPNPDGTRSSGMTTPVEDGRPGQSINDIYRLSLANRLRPKLSDEPLPSTEFLKLCVRMYFCRVNPVFPVLHRPTLKPTAANGALILSICSVGSLFVGTAEAAHYGAVLFDRLLKAMCQSWDLLMARDIEERVPMVQTAIIGQNFGLLSGDPRHLAIVEVFHGCLITWARRANLFSLENEPLDLEGLSKPQLGKAWSSWARKEECKRAALAVYIQDAEIAALFHHEPFLRHRRRRIAPACSTEAFFASTVDDWFRAIKSDVSPELDITPSATSSPPILGYVPGLSRPLSIFSAYTILEGIGAAISEDRVLGQFDCNSAWTYESDLVSWYEAYGARMKSESDPQCLLILWHYIFMTNLVDFDRLEIAVGKKGAVAAVSCTDYITEWSASTDSKRCLIHAFLLQKEIENMPQRRVLAVHGPRCLFSAAIAWSVYLRSVSDTTLNSLPTQNSDFSELRLLGVNFSNHWSSVIGVCKGNLSTVKGATLCRLADMLRETHHWEIAQRFSQVLAPLIHGGADSFLLSYSQKR